MNIVLPTDEMIREINNRFVELCLRKESCMKDLIAFLEPDLEQYIDWNWIHSLTRITALVACEHRIDMVRFCIEHGSDIDYLGEVNRLNMLHVASMKKYIEVVNCILEFGGNVNCYDDMSYSPLMEACLLNDVNLVKCLLAQGACIDTQSQFGTTALMLACKEGCLDIVQILVERQANRTFVTKAHQWTALHFAEIHHNYKVKEYLLSLVDIK